MVVPILKREWALYLYNAGTNSPIERENKSEVSIEREKDREKESERERKRERESRCAPKVKNIGS